MTHLNKTRLKINTRRLEAANNSNSESSSSDEDFSPKGKKSVSAENVATLVTSFKTVALKATCMGHSFKDIEFVLNIIKMCEDETHKSATVKMLSSLKAEMKIISDMGYTVEEAQMAFDQSKEMDKDLTTRMTEFMRSKNTSFAFYDEKTDALMGIVGASYAEFINEMHDVPKASLFTIDQQIMSVILNTYKKSITALKEPSFEALKVVSSFLMATLGAAKDDLTQLYLDSVKKVTKKITSAPKASRNFPSEMFFLENGPNVDYLEAPLAFSKILPHLHPSFSEYEIQLVEHGMPKAYVESSYDVVFDNVKPLLCILQAEELGCEKSLFLDPTVSNAYLYENNSPLIESSKEYDYAALVTNSEPLTYSDDDQVMAVKAKWSSALTPAEMEKAATFGFVDKATFFSHQKAWKKNKIGIGYNFEEIFRNNVFIEVCFETALVLVIPIEWMNQESDLLYDGYCKGLFPITPGFSAKSAFVTAFAMAVRSRALFEGRFYANADDVEYIWNGIARSQRPTSRTILDKYLNCFVLDHTPRIHNIIRQATSIKDEEILGDQVKHRWNRDRTTIKKHLRQGPTFRTKGKSKISIDTPDPTEHPELVPEPDKEKSFDDPKDSSEDASHDTPDDVKVPVEETETVPDPPEPHVSEDSPPSVINNDGKTLSFNV